MARTSLGTGAAGHTLLFVDLGNAGLGVDVDGVKLAGLHAVATAQAAKAAGSFAGAAGVHGRTGAQSGILGNLGPVGASAITSHYGHLGIAIGNSHAQQVGHLAHDVGTANGAVQPLQAAGVGTLDKGVGHTPTAGKAAAAAVGTGQQLSNLGDAGVFINSKFLGGGKQHQRCYQADGSKHNHCNPDKIHKCFVLL